MTGVSPQTNDSVGSNVGRLLLQLPDQLVPDVAGQLGQALDLSSYQALEAGPDIAEHVPALDLAGNDQALVLHGLVHTRLIGGVDLHCLHLGLGRHDGHWWTDCLL